MLAEWGVVVPGRVSSDPQRPTVWLSRLLVKSVGSLVIKAPEDLLTFLSPSGNVMAEGSSWLQICSQVPLWWRWHCVWCTGTHELAVESSSRSISACRATVALGSEALVALVSEM